MQLLLNHKARSLCTRQNLCMVRSLPPGKMFCVLIIAVSSLITLKGYSQGISLSLKNAPLERVFKLIEQQTNFKFVYSQEAMKHATPVSIEVKNESLNNVLKLSFANQLLTYSLKEKFIIIKVERKKTEIIEPLPNIEGKVTNENGAPLAGVTISLLKSNKATLTNEQGGFSLKRLSVDDILVATSVGYFKEEIKVNKQTYVVIALKPSVALLDETLIIGYGSSTKRYNVGSVTKISSDDISKQSQGNVLATLEGKSPGLVVSQSTGLPGSSIRVQIRGQNSLKTNPGSSFFRATYDYPLFIIDGVPFAPQNSNVNQFSSIGAAGNANPVNRDEGMSPFNSLNPDDIESIEILRDADATAIYGSRGANGVIIISTKKGKAGKTKFSLNGYTGVSSLARTTPLLNTTQYLQMRREAFYNDSIDNPSANVHPDIFNAPDLLVFDSARSTDWRQYFLGGTANTTSFNGSISGGNDNTQFLLGSGYRKETYIFPGNFSDQKISFNTNINHRSNNRKFLLNFSTTYSYSNNTSSSSSELLRASFLPPNYPDLVNNDGTIQWNYKGVNLYNNPLGQLRQKYRLETYNHLSHLQLGYEVLPALTVRSSFGYNKFEVNENAQTPAATQNPLYNPTGSSYFGINNYRTYIIEPQAEYKKSIYNGKIEFLIGFTYQQTVNNQTNINAYGYTNDALLNSPSGSSSVNIYDNESIYKYAAGFGRANYIYKGKYIIDLSGRRDGSSRFGPGKQFGNFGAIGGGWIFSEEPFTKSHLKWISYGKLKASYGTTGNDNIGNYQYLPAWAASYNNYEGTRGYIPQNLYNPDFSWAVNKKLQAGFELGILSDKVVTEIVWYRNRCENQLVSYILPNQTGFSNVTQNFDATVQNSGVEIQINSVIIKHNTFSWTNALNISFPRNKLIAFPGLDASAYAYYYVIGKSLSVLRRFNSIGVNDTTGVYQFTTAEKSPTYVPVDPNDNFIIGATDPRYYGGFTNSFSFKGFELDINIEFKKQLGLNYLGQVVNNTPPGILNALYGNQPAMILNRWQHPGDKTSVEKFTADYSSPAAQVFYSFFNSSGSYSDASYLRLKTVSLAYNFSEKFLKKMGMKSCRIYVNAQNILTITKYKGTDPETQSFYGIPPLKTIAAGLQFNF